MKSSLTTPTTQKGGFLKRLNRDHPHAEGRGASHPKTNRGDPKDVVQKEQRRLQEKQHFAPCMGTCLVSLQGALPGVEELSVCPSGARAADIDPG